MSIRHLMTAKPLTVSLHDTLAAAAERMWAGDCGCLPVVNDEGAVIAMITDRDICMATWSRNQPPQAIGVPEAMSQSLVVCRSDDTVEEVERAMRSAQVRRLPVVDDGKLSGIISLADIVTHNARSERPHGSGESNGVSSTLAIICQRPVLRSASAGDAPTDDTPAQPGAVMSDSRP
jgi:CBS domain-containing protein